MNKKKKDENSFNFSTKSSIEATKSSIEENKIIYDTIENLIICEVVNDLIYIVIAESCHVYLKLLPQNELDVIDQDLHRNGIFFEDLNNETDSKEIINTFNYFFYSYGRFPSNLNLITVPQGHIPRFLKAEDDISLNKLYRDFNRNECRGLASTQFFTALSTYLCGNMQLSKTAMTEFFSNLSMQALSKSNNNILLSFTQIENLATTLIV